MNAENQPLITEEPVEFENKPVDVQDCRKITHHSRGIHGIFLKHIDKNQKTTTYHWLDLGTLAFDQLSRGGHSMSN